MIYKSNKLELIRELVEMTDGTEVQSVNTHELDVNKILSVPLGTVLYPQLSVAQAKAFVEKCMEAGVTELQNITDDIADHKLQMQHPSALIRKDKPYRGGNRNQKDYGEQ